MWGAAEKRFVSGHRFSYAGNGEGQTPLSRRGYFEAQRLKGGIRELHWHPNADEWQYYIAGTGRMTVFATVGRARTMDFQAGDVGYVLKTLPHYVQNTGDTDLKFLEMFKSSFYQDLALSEWHPHLPPDLVLAHLGIDKATLDAMPKDEVVVMPK